MQIETIAQENLAQALALVERVFTQFDAPDYLPEGTVSFRAFLHDPEALALHVFYGAYVEDTWRGLSGLGTMIAPVYQVTVSTTEDVDLRLYSLDLTFEQGEVFG